MNSASRVQIRTIVALSALAFALVAAPGSVAANDNGLTHVNAADTHPHARPWPVHLEGFRKGHVTEALHAERGRYPSARQWPVHLESFRVAGPTAAVYTDASIRGRAKHWPVHSIDNGH